MYLAYDYVEDSLASLYTASEVVGGANKPDITLDEAKNMIYELLAAVNHCHSRRFMHKNICEPAIRADKDGSVRLNRFDLAGRYREGKPRDMNVTMMWHRAPEILLGQSNYTPLIDKWSVSCVAARLFSIAGDPLFRGGSEIDQLYKIFQVLGMPTEDTWPGVAELPGYSTFFPRWRAEGELEKLLDTDALGDDGLDSIRRMWSTPPDNRISAMDASKHPFFSFTESLKNENEKKIVCKNRMISFFKKNKNARENVYST
jgi:serine/threonine protein kinase